MARSTRSVTTTSWRIFSIRRTSTSNCGRRAANIFENEAREHVAREGLDKKGFTNEFIRERVRQLAAQENFANLVRRVKATLEGSPESVKELRKLAREGEVVEGGESASVKHKEIMAIHAFFHAEYTWPLVSGK